MKLQLLGGGYFAPDCPPFAPPPVLLCAATRSLLARRQPPVTTLEGGTPPGWIAVALAPPKSGPSCLLPCSAVAPAVALDLRSGNGQKQAFTCSVVGMFAECLLLRLLVRVTSGFALEVGGSVSALLPCQATLQPGRFVYVAFHESPLHSHCRRPRTPPK